MTNKLPHSIYRIGQVLTVLAFISLKLLLDDNMGMTNEVDVLPLAKQFANSTWIAEDWYLNQSPGYRLLFALLFGKLIVAWGFLATSIVGRLICYGLVALGLVLIGECLGLTLPLLLTAIGLFLYSSPNQGIAAQEWLVRSLEAKAIAYGLVLLAIYYLLRQKYPTVALFLGLATSFHVLVGGWATLIVFAQVMIKYQFQFSKFDRLHEIGLIYLLSSFFAIPPVIAQLFSTIELHTIPPSFIYVFLRLPHHLNPASWEPLWGLRLVSCLFCLLLSMKVLHRHQKNWQMQQYQAQVDLFQLTLISLVPFVAGLAIAPFDSQGSWLQFYPFRVGDVLLPLNTWLLLACAVQSFVAPQKAIQLTCISWLVFTCSLQLPTFQAQVAALNQFPNRHPEFIALCNWVKTQTPTDAIIISPPVEFVEFNWLAERSTIANYKLLPQTKTRIIEWYERLADLSGGTFPKPALARTRDPRKNIRKQLTQGYKQLKLKQVKNLVRKYSASYLITTADHRLELPIAYQNNRYILYKASNG
ncbi:DUF6798 domain-containing protein [Pantanalinema rosaneae]|uniref:DUF6798 domain-containing protein n=1 Tax=Pantanalinema rosaneae TaxID=1620701 RepID=UPI003D6E4A22